MPSDLFTADLAFYVALGFFAQLVDGALGMAYGLIITSTLLASGTPPAVASASVHAAEVVTTGLAGTSHVLHRNVDWSLVRRIAPAGVVGGILGAYLLTGLPERPVRIFVAVYLVVMAALIVWRLLAADRTLRRLVPTPLLGLGGGFFDAIGGGGWGPIVNATLIARGEEPRRSIGSASVCEFFVTVAISAAFVATLDLSSYGKVVLGLVLGGALAAPFAGWFPKVLPLRVLMGLVALLLSALSVYNLVRLFA